MCFASIAIVHLVACCPYLAHSFHLKLLYFLHDCNSIFVCEFYNGGIVYWRHI